MGSPWSNSSLMALLAMRRGARTEIANTNRLTEVTTLMRSTREPTADERMADGWLLIAAATAKVTHLPRYGNSRHGSLYTLCGKAGFFVDRLDLRAKHLTTGLCAECKRRAGGDDTDAGGNGYDHD